MADVLTPLSALEELDRELLAACNARTAAFRRMVIKDSTVNRETYADACDEVDALLELRHDIAH